MVPLQQSAVITQKNQLNPHVYQFVFQVKTPVVFTPGQYATVIIDAHTRRQYSFFSPSTNPLQFDIVIDVAPMGPGSKFFLDKNVGDTVEILAPLGGFRMIENPNKKVFLATGTGIAPFYSMIVSYVKHGGKATVVLYWGLRQEEDIFFQPQLDALKKSSANFQYSIILSKPTSDWKGHSGHVTDYVVKEESDFYLSGNKNMVGEVKTKLLAQKVSGEQIKTEPF